MKSKFLFLILLAIGLTSSIDAQIKDPVLFSINKGACKGSCPQYTMEVHQSGLLLFNGIKHTSKVGYHTKQLSRTQLLEIKNAFEIADFKSLKEYYDSRVPDFPTIIIKHHMLNKAVTGKETRPKTVLDIEKMLTRYADTKEGWRVLPKPGKPKGSIQAVDKKKEVSKVKSENTLQSPIPPPITKRNEIIVVMSPRHDIMNIVRKYNKIGLKIDRRLTANGFDYLLKWEFERMGGKQLMASLKKEEGVMDVQYTIPTQTSTDK